MKMMIDLETWGKEMDSEIIAVGVVIFDQEIKEMHKWCIMSQPHRSRDPETVTWWMSRKETLMTLLNAPKHQLEDVLCWINDLHTTNGVTEVWAKSPTFDLMILDHAYDQANLNKPWRFFEEQDVRTVEALLGISKLSKSLSITPHDPLSDCIAQVENVIKLIGALK
jgi:hypothetical protein